MYIYPNFGDKEYFNIIRVGGPGLGNLLFPYFRAYIYAIRYKGNLIDPIWPTFKLGPILRNELDNRFYSLQFMINVISCFCFSLRPNGRTG